MKFSVYAASTIAAAVLVSAFTGGCVPKSDYQRALDANVTAQRELQLAREQSGQFQEQLRLSQVDMDAARRSVQQKQQVVDQLREAIRQANERFAELQARYKRDTADIGPAPLGAIALPEELDRQLLLWAEKYPDLVNYDRQRGMVKLKTDLVFPSGSDQVTAGANETLSRFAELLKSAVADDFNIYIAGHTDDVPIGKPATRRRHPDNWYLSVHRAVSVMKVMAAAGVEPARLGVMGFSEYHPVAPNAANKKGNELNRRVELWIVPTDQFLTTDMPVVKSEEEK